MQIMAICFFSSFILAEVFLWTTTHWIYNIFVDIFAYRLEDLNKTVEWIKIEISTHESGV